MTTAVLYTVLSLLNLIGFTVGVSLLPAEVPIHFDASLTADAVGSPWVFLALPGAAALISAGIWASLVQKKNRGVTVGVLTALGIALATVGWTFFALVAGGVRMGGRADFPTMLVILFPLSLLAVWLGNFLLRLAPNRTIGIRTRATLKSDETWRRAHRFCGGLYFVAGLFAAAVALIFGTVPALGALQFIAPVLAAVLLGGATIAAAVYVRGLSRRRADATP